MLIYIRGAGDIASGIAMRLRRSGFRVVMTDVARPTAIRRTVSCSGAIIGGSQRVEDVTARLAHTPEEALGEDGVHDGVGADGREVGTVFVYHHGDIAFIHYP